MHKPIWDIFCQVIDNWGDAGVCWRLASQLSERGIHVRLWIDDPAPLNWMGASQTTVEIIQWQDPLPYVMPADVLVEAFGCRVPDTYWAQAGGATHTFDRTFSFPVWINLEYLSAQNYVERSHGLPSPQHSGLAKGQTRWFYYPGFSQKTGGLLRETHLYEQQQTFNKKTWLQKNGIPYESNDTCLISLFSYHNHALPMVLNQWQQATQPVHVLVTPGATAKAINHALGVTPPDAIEVSKEQTQTQLYTQKFNQLTVTWLPYLTQDDFDRLLWSCDINFVRGEDSWIRAIWAGKPLIWQPYTQDDGEHMHKLEAFLALVPDAPQAWQTFEHQWTTQTTPDWHTLQASLPQTNAALKQLRSTLSAMPDLVTQLLDFVKSRQKK